MLDALDALQSWIDKIQQDELDVAGTRTREPDGFMTVYHDPKTSKPFNGKMFADRDAALVAAKIHSRQAKPQFMVRVFLKE